MQASLELYTNSMSPFTQRVELQLEMKGVEFARTFPQRDYVRQGEFGAISPIRKIPVLVVGGVPIAETQVICELIEDIHPQPSLLPDGALDRARARLLARIIEIYVAGPLVLLLNNLWDKRSEDIAAYATSTAERGLISLEHWIAPGPYAAAGKRTIADCAIPPALFFLQTILPALGIERVPDIGPNTARYFEAIQKDRDVSHCLTRMESGLRDRLAKARA